MHSLKYRFKNMTHGHRGFNRKKAFKNVEAGVTFFFCFLYYIIRDRLLL